MKICLITTRRWPDPLSPIMADLVRLLGEWDVEVEVLHPEDQLADVGALEPDCDLFLIKSESELALSLAGALHAVGARTLNRYPVAARCHNRLIASRILYAAGVPVPQTFAALHPGRLAPLLDAGPLVIKPHRGSRGHGVHVVYDADALEAITANDGLVLAQRYHRPDGRDRKIYCIGGQLFGVKRVFPARTYEEKLGEPFPVTPDLRDIALRCGEAFGIDLFGVDVIVSDGRPYVVDVSSFPGFKGVPDAPLRLADYVYAAARSAAEDGAFAATARGAVGP